MSKMIVEVIPCSATPLIYDEENVSAATPVQKSASAILFCQIRKKGNLRS